MNWGSNPLVALTAGQAPSCEQRAHERAASWRAAFHRACHWLECLCQASPTLQDEPLLGTCLGDITASLTCMGKPQPPEPKPRRRFDPRIAPELEKQIRCSSTENDVRPALPSQDTNAAKPARERRAATCRTQPPPAQQQRRADSNLLYHLCPRGSSGPAQAPPRPRALSVPSSCPSPQPAPHCPASLHDWFCHLSERVERQLQSKDLGADVQRHRALLARGARGGDRHVFLDRGTSAGNSHPGSLPLIGETVSENLLLDLCAQPVSAAGKPRPVQAGEPEAGEKGEARVSDSASRRSRRKTVSASAGHPDAGNSELENDAMQAALRSHILNTSSDFPASDFPASDPPVLPFSSSDTAEPGNAHASQSISPRSSLPLLPPLMTASLVRQANNIEDAYRQEEDMAVLADKIKRILNDEARRFGIDV
jgi:hypothetical protein